MLAHGVLEDVDAALAYHVGSGRMPVGVFMYNSDGTMMYSVDGFRITIHGRVPMAHTRKIPSIQSISASRFTLVWNR